VIVMTSNIGSLYLLDGLTGDGEITEEARTQVMGELRGHFRPEFLNRVDDIVLFKPLTLREIERIVDLQIADVRKRLADRHIDLQLTEPARELIAREGYDPVYGARPLRRFIQREIETRIARALLTDEIRDGATVALEVDDDEPVVRWSNPDAGEERQPEAEADRVVAGV